MKTKNFDLIVVGSGAAGLTCAITAKKRGLDVVVLEKEPVFGGTTALSGGVLWVPLNAHGQKQNAQDNAAGWRRRCGWIRTLDAPPQITTGSCPKPAGA